MPVDRSAPDHLTGITGSAEDAALDNLEPEPEVDWQQRADEFVAYLDSKQPRTRTAVYYLLAGDTLLYVGMSSDLETRLATHRRTKPWFGEVTDVRVQWFPTRRAAATRESQAIRRLQPVHNIVRPASLPSEPRLIAALRALSSGPAPECDHCGRRSVDLHGGKCSACRKYLQRTGEPRPDDLVERSLDRYVI